jgi:hypothetical protein
MAASPENFGKKSFWNSTFIQKEKFTVVTFNGPSVLIINMSATVH